jgi:hypothetical protein
LPDYFNVVSCTNTAAVVRDREVLGSGQTG